MVYRVYVEKKEALANEARALLEDLRAFLGIQSLTGLRLFNRYDLEGISRELFDYAVQTVLSEPQLDTVTSEVPQGDTVFAVEYLPGQYDQRADSAAQCIQILSQGERPTVRTARVYVLEGELTAEQVEAVKKYVINPVESREASLELPETLRMEYDIPTTVRTVEGFTSMDAAALDALRDELGLAMDLDDLKFLQGYFRDDEGRNPTITEIRVVDTYWSDHCRHTTFSTHIDQVEIHDAAIQAAYERYLAARVEVYGEEKAAKRPQTLMDIATIGAKVLKKRGLLPELDESEEINACSIHVTATVDGEAQDWLLMFKNETHNHPTEIEPFGGAATCIGGCIRDPLSGRAYVHQAMRVTPVPLWTKPSPASCLSGSCARPPPRAIPPTATRSALPPAMWRSCTTRATSPSVWNAARWWRRLPPIMSAVSAPFLGMWSFCWAAAPDGTASAAPPVLPRVTT